MDIIQLAENIANLVQNDNYVAGHAILNRNEIFDETLPNKILKKGLTIQDASCGLQFNSKYFR